MTAAIRKGYLDGPYGQIHYRTAGERDKTPLILLHQSPLTSGQFQAALPSLAAAGYFAIAIDTPGYGLSDPPPVKPSIATYVDALPPVFSHFGLGGAHLLGHHTGAVIAAAFAAKSPQHVRHLILNGVPVLSEEEKAFFATLTFAPMELKEDGSHLLAAWNQRLKASPGWTRLDVMHRYTVDTLANPDRYFWAFDAVFSHDVEGDLRALTCQSTIMTNTGEDLYEASKRAHALRPDFGFVSLDGGTHDIVDEQTDAWVAAVSAILR